MSRAQPPSPQQFRTIEEWATEFYEFYLSQTRIREENDPLPVLLAHRTDGGLERATTNGIMLFDPIYDTMVVSENGKWEPHRNQPLVFINYDTAFNVNGATISTGGVKIPFDNEEVNLSSWATFNSGSNDIDLLQGTYAIEGFVTISKISGGAKAFTGYLAESSDLTTPVGTVKLGTLSLPANAPNGQTFVVPFRGQIDVPEGGGTYAMVVNTSNSNTRFGTAHNISGYENIYARLSISLTGLNE